MLSQAEADANLKLFGELKKEFSLIDPVSFAESYLTVDGRPFNMTGNGWRWMTELYREVAAQATSQTAKPMVILKGRQVGATILAAVLSLYFTASGLYGSGVGKPPMRILHVFPTLGIMAKYAKDKLNPMMQGSQGGYIAKRSIRKDKKLGHDALDDTITEKTFLGFNKLRIDSLGKEGDRLRGLSQDGIFFDEVQEMGKRAIENALRILTSAQYGPQNKGIQLYFGTPKNAGSYFYDIWQDSDQRFYQPRCLKCKEYFYLYTMGSDEWKKIWIKGFDIKCPSCGHIQDKRESIEQGRWQPTKDPATCRFIGYHVNLILSPTFTRETVMDMDPSINRNRSERAWRNETLGEFYSGVGAPLSPEEIQTDPTRGLASGIRESSDKIYTMGIDWGDKPENEDGEGDESKERGQSYTAVVITSIDKRGVFTVENAYRLKDNSFTHKIDVIQELFNRFRIKNAAADYYWGQDVVNHMQNTLGYGSKFLGCINSGSLGTMISYKPKELRVMLNKDMMIDEVFAMFRKGKIVFPEKDMAYDKLYWLVQHCCSMEVKMAQKYGNYYKKYIKGISPNDGLQAILYAVIAYRFISTNGFKNSQDAKTTNLPPLPTLAYAPKLR